MTTDSTRRQADTADATTAFAEHVFAATPSRVRAAQHLPGRPARLVPRARRGGPARCADARRAHRNPRALRPRVARAAGGVRHPHRRRRGCRGIRSPVRAAGRRTPRRSRTPTRSTTSPRSARFVGVARRAARAAARRVPRRAAAWRGRDLGDDARDGAGRHQPAVVPAPARRRARRRAVAARRSSPAPGARSPTSAWGTAGRRSRSRRRTRGARGGLRRRRGIGRRGAPARRGGGRRRSRAVPPRRRRGARAGRRLRCRVRLRGAARHAASRSTCSPRSGGP